MSSAMVLWLVQNKRVVEVVEVEKVVKRVGFLEWVGDKKWRELMDEIYIRFEAFKV